MNAVRRTAAAAVAALSLLAGSAALAQDKMSGGGKMMDKKPAMAGSKMAGGKIMGQSVYACKECKMYYSAADAKKMSMKDGMGHKLMRMTRASADKMGMKMSMNKSRGGSKMMHGSGGKM